MNIKMKGKISLTICLVFLIGLFLFSPAIASETDGTILSANKWVWGSKSGWVNFSATNGNIHITDSALTGSAWNELYGWIKLDPASSGVKNTSAGVLSGNAWNEHLGWIDFSGVTIDSNGLFVGQATGDNIGVLNFSCANCSVKTDWRPTSSRTVANLATGGGAVNTTPPTPSPGGFKVFINNDSANTNSNIVKVYLYGSSNIAYVFISENGNLIPAAHLPYLYDQNSTYYIVDYNLSDGFGIKTIYVKFCTQSGFCSDEIFSDSINYISTPVVPEKPISKIKIPQIIAKIPQAVKQISEEIKKLAKDLTEKAVELPKIAWVNLPLISGSMPLEKFYSGLKFAIPQFAQKLIARSTIPLEQIVTKATPLSMKGDLALATRSVNSYVFAPLPREFLALQEKFPEVKTTFREVGISRMQDLEKMRFVTMRLPGLTRSLALAPVGTAGLTGERLAPLPAVPLSKMSLVEKSRIPTNIMFPRSPDQLVDYNIELTLSNEGKPEQRIATISGKPLTLSVKPDKEVRRVRGYVLFKSRKTPAQSVSFNLSTLFQSVSFIEPVLAKDYVEPLAAEERLVLMSFDYTDPDGDGIYTAEIVSPVPVGEYEILTVMDYEDITLGSKEIRLITVVDPEGYVFESVKNQELRIAGAIVTINWLNPETNQYEEWPANKYQQENPQITDVRGTYSFLVPQGMYSIKVESPGYLSYESKSFEVLEGGGVHMNVQMKTKYWRLSALNWEIGVLFLVVALLGYNFYRDKKREKK